MKTLYTNGCSFSANILRNLEGDIVVDGGWPLYLGDTLGYNVVNHSQTCGSNDRIFRTSLAWISENISRDILVILQPAQGVRREFYSRDNGWLHFKKDSYTWHRHKYEQESMRLYEKYLMMDHESQSRSLCQILSLQEFLEKNKIEYYFLETRYYSRAMLHNNHPLKKLVRWDKWLHNHFEMQLDVKITENHELYYNHGHLSIKGHKRITEEILHEIRKNSGTF